MLCLFCLKDTVSVFVCADQKMKADILQRLESIPSSGNKDEEDDSDDSSGSSTDNELIVDKLAKSSPLRDDPPAPGDGSVSYSTFHQLVVSMIMRQLVDTGHAVYEPVSYQKQIASP